MTLKLQLVKSLQQRYKRQLKPSNNTIADNRSNQQFPSITTSSPLESVGNYLMILIVYI